MRCDECSVDMPNANGLIHSLCDLCEEGIRRSTIATLTAERDRAQSALVVEQRMAADAGAQEFRAMRELAEVKVERDAAKARRPSTLR